MRVAAFIQAYNELSKGHLIRCLENVKQWADDIFIYDDCSTDGSQDVYLKYTTSDKIIFGAERRFKQEQFNKAKLLELTLSFNPDWILWIDVDTILDGRLIKDLKPLLTEADKYNIDGIQLHNVNLWRSECYFRLDDSFDSCNPICIWKNNGKLHYSPNEGLHGQLYPNGMTNIKPAPYFLIHYGFASKKWITDKYELYKSMGQSGWALDRLITEGPGFEVGKLHSSIYPPENLPADYDTVEPLVALGSLI